jgi:hypothetical protein
MGGCIVLSHLVIENFQNKTYLSYLADLTAQKWTVKPIILHNFLNQSPQYFSCWTTPTAFRLFLSDQASYYYLGSDKSQEGNPSLVLSAGI